MTTEASKQKGKKKISRKFSSWGHAEFSCYLILFKNLWKGLSDFLQF